MGLECTKEEMAFLKKVLSFLGGPRAKNAQFYQKSDIHKTMLDLKATKWWGQIVTGFVSTKDVDPYIFTSFTHCNLNLCWPRKIKNSL